MDICLYFLGKQNLHCCGSSEHPYKHFRRQFNYFIVSRQTFLAKFANNESDVLFFSSLSCRNFLCLLLFSI